MEHSISMGIFSPRFTGSDFDEPNEQAVWYSMGRFGQ